MLKFMHPKCEVIENYLSDIEKRPWVYRDEQSGELAGLSRVLSITQDDAHIFCTENQLEEEINNTWNLIENFIKLLIFKISLLVFQEEMTILNLKEILKVEIKLKRLLKIY